MHYRPCMLAEDEGCYGVDVGVIEVVDVDGAAQATDGSFNPFPEIR